MLEHDHEPIPGLPQALPDGEKILWQGRPEAGSLAYGTFHLRKLVLYFAAILVLRFTLQLSNGAELSATATSTAGLAGLAAAAIGLLLLYTRLLAQATVFTITNRRIVLRSGVALPLTINLPFARIESADVRMHRDGSGDIALVTDDASRVSYVLLWPMVKPWRWLRVRPVLRGVSQANDVAAVLAAGLVEATAAENERTSRAATDVVEQPAARDTAGSGPARRRWRAYPTVPLAAAASLIIIAVVAVAGIRLAGVAPEKPATASAIASVNLYFEDHDDGSVRVIDASDGTVIDELPPGTNGFVRGTLRSLVRARRAADVGSDTPFSLRETETGRLLFHDSATGREIDLWAFGPTNAGVFRRFLEQDSPQTVATATQPALESDGPEVTAVALKKQETTP